MKVKTKELLDLGVIDDAIEDEITGTSRRSEHHRIVFKYKGKTYQSHYRCGAATEMQDEYPWEHDHEVELEEVEKKEITVTKWVPVEHHKNKSDVPI